YISWWQVIALNLGTFVVCLIALIIPTLIVSKISPVKAMRFE
ncbi:MAG: lipoprotein-releasing system permease protein, partial [Nonlabens sp.]